MLSTCILYWLEITYAVASLHTAVNGGAGVQGSILDQHEWCLKWYLVKPCTSSRDSVVPQRVPCLAVHVDC